MRMRVVRVVAVMVCALGGAGAARATSEVAQGLHALVASSRHVVVGHVATVEPYVDRARRSVFTRVRIVVSETLKGAAADTLTIVQRGGEAEGLRVTIEGMRRFRAGEEVVLFTWQGRSGEETVNGIRQGAYAVERDEATGAASVLGLPPEDLPPGAALTVSGAASAAREPLSTALTRIRAVLAGARGQRTEGR